MHPPLPSDRPDSLLLRGVSLLEAPNLPACQAEVRIDASAGHLLGWSPWPSEGNAPAEVPASGPIPQAAVQEIDARGCWLGPPLVDPHSVLEEPWQGRAETLPSLGATCAAGGYGTVALLPWARGWRDRPERLDLRWPEPLTLRLWGSFSGGGTDADLAQIGRAHV